MTYLFFFGLIISAYLIGSIPTGVLISKWFFGFDIREKGSGNTGSTNAIRVLGTKWGLFIQLIDILKGYLPVVLLVPVFFTNHSLFGLSSESSLVLTKIITGIFAAVGHIFPIFAGFKGGKGVNTAGGVLLALIPIETGIGLFIFIIVLISTGYVSIGSMIGLFAVMASLLIRHLLGVQIIGFNFLFVFSIFVFLAVVITHKSNIKRLLKGEENRFDKARIFKVKKK